MPGWLSSVDRIDAQKKSCWVNMFKTFKLRYINLENVFQRTSLPDGLKVLWG